MLSLFLGAAAATARPYAIGGALAMRAHGYRRYTDDVDAFVAYEDRVDWIRALREQGLVVVPMFAGVQYRAMMPGYTTEEDAAIDLLVPAEEPELSAIDAPDEGVLDEQVVAVWPVSLLVIAKFRSTRPKDDTPMRLLSREELSRTLAAHCVFGASAKMLDGDDRATMAHLRKLRRRIQDERGEVLDRVIRNLQALVKVEGG